MIRTSDNNLGRCQVLGEDLDNLKRIAGTRLVELMSDSGNELWLFPKDKALYGDRIENETIFTLNDDKLTTGNIMGFIGCGKTEITIHSRFSASYETDFFMQYLLQKVFAVNIFDLSHSYANDNALDFSLLLFPYFLQKALLQGLYREYRRIDYNDDRIRGAINFSRHIKNNFPFKDGRVAYSTKEYRYDNPITQLVRHTIEYIRSHKYSFILYANKDIREYVQIIIDATPSYRKGDLVKVMAQNIKPKIHPYYSEYRPLQELCLKILHRARISYGFNSDRIRGVLFDGAWLWEEYLATVLKMPNLEHPKNKEHEGGLNLYVGARGKFFPDFTHPQMVADAKYKRYYQSIEETRDFIPRDDLYQMISYLHLTKKKIGALICPRDWHEDVYDEDGWNTVSHSLRILQGLGGEIHVVALNIPDNCSDYDSFCERMQSIESSLIYELGKIIADSTSEETILLDELGL